MRIAGLDLSINGTGIVCVELDNDLNVLSQDYLGFTSVKKLVTDKILFFKKENFSDYIEKNLWVLEKIKDFIKDVEYVSIEDYALNAKGRVFDIGEYTGLIKHVLYAEDKKIRLYDPLSIKLFACGTGNTKIDKTFMQYAYEQKENFKEFMSSDEMKAVCDALRIKNETENEEEKNKRKFFFKEMFGEKSSLEFKSLPDYKSPKADVIDAYYILKMLQLELKLRKAKISLSDLPEYIIKVFNRVTKSRPINILATPFLSND